MHHYFFSVATAPEQRHDACSQFETLSGRPKGFHAAGTLQTEHRAFARRSWIESSTLQQIRAVQRRSVHSQSDLTRSWFRVRQLSYAQDFRAASSAANDSFHVPTTAGLQRCKVRRTNDPSAFTELADQELDLTSWLSENVGS